MNDKHGDLGAVLGLGEDLLGLVIVLFENRFWFFEEGGGVRFDVVAVDRTGRGEGAEGVECFQLSELSVEATGGSDAGQGD